MQFLSQTTIILKDVFDPFITKYSDLNLGIK